MTIPRVRPAGWGTHDLMSSGEANGLDLNPTYALDKRAGQTDALASVVACGGAGRIVDSYAVGADADTTYLLSGANSIIDASGILTVDRAYTLSNTGAVNGDRVMILYNGANASLAIKDSAGGTQIVLGANVSGAAGSLSNGESSWVDMIWSGAWRVWRSSKPAILTPTTYIANGTWTCPRGCYLALLIGYGGGGAGGGGSQGSGSNNLNSATGGGGGGGSQLSSQLVAVTPGTAYAVVIGAGGIAVIASATGTDGSSTTFGTLATFAGAGGGASTSSTGSGVACQTFGGTPVALNAAVTSVHYTGRTTLLLSPGGDSVQTPPGSGGRSLNQALNNIGYVSLAGTPSVQGFAGGVGGGYGGTSTGVGGGGGGGGGGGPAGVGGAGGTGGNGSATIATTSGTAGTSAAANTGAGGGGGGGGGTSTAGGAVGSASGAGGSGRLQVIPMR
jgi:hypothetical protein